jgi:hypothetical protein
VWQRLIGFGDGAERHRDCSPVWAIEGGDFRSAEANGLARRLAGPDRQAKRYIPGTRRHGQSREDDELRWSATRLECVSNAQTLSPSRKINPPNAISKLFSCLLTNQRLTAI